MPARLWQRALTSAIGCWLGLGAAAAFGYQPDTALGTNGELYQLRTGTYGDLFPGRRQTDRANRVLALEIVRPGELPARLLVPATEGPEPEGSAALVFESESNTVFVLWESRTTANSSILRLSGYDGTRWLSAIEIAGNSAAVKTSPQLAVTRQVVAVPAAAVAVGVGVGGGPGVVLGPAIKHQTVLHLCWAEDGAGHGVYDTFYTPVILEDGAYLGWNPIYRLNDFDSAGLSVPAAGGSPELQRAPTLSEGRDGRTIVVSFASTVSGHLVVLQIDLPPSELQQLADGARATIIDTGRQLDLSQPGVLGQLAEKARATVESLGGFFEPEVIESMADHVRGQIAGGGSNDLVSLAEGARATIIDTGVRLGGHGLRTGGAFAETRKVVQINRDPEHSDQAAPPGELGHLFEFQVVSSRPLPQPPQGGAGAIQVFLSQSGQNQIVSWASPDQVLYRESTADGWSDVRAVQLTDTLDLAKAYDTLAQRVRGK
jgi:hypothetical protein